MLGCQHGQLLLKVLFLAYRQPPSCILTWQRERERDDLFPTSSYKGRYMERDSIGFGTNVSYIDP